MSASPLAVIGEGVENVVDDSVMPYHVPQATVEISLDNAASSAEHRLPNPLPVGLLDNAATEIDAARVELVFIDDAAANVEQLVEDLQTRRDESRELLVYSLDSDSDGVEQITEILAGQSGFAAIHLVSHGTDGQIKLGNTWLSHANIADYRGALQGWSHALEPRADLLIYGCDLAANAEGRALAQTLGAWCQCNVAASVDDTGHASRGADWDLEFATASIETPIAFSESLQEEWLGLLAANVVVVDTTADIADAPDSSTLADLLSDVGPDNKISLREAILATNGTANLDTPDEIHFNIPDTDSRHFYYRDDATADSLSLVVTTTSDDGSIGDFDPDDPYSRHSWFSIYLNSSLPQLEITDPVIIDGYTQPGASANNLAVGTNAALRIELTSDGTGGNRGLTVENGGDNSVIRGLVINNFSSAGILTEPNADDIAIEGNFIGTDVTGTKAVGNGDAGVHLRSSDNRVGGPTEAERNLISGNDFRGITTFTFSGLASDNIFENNYIGVQATGLAALPNGQAGIQVYNQSGMQILDNVISGNDGEGVWLRSGSTKTSTVIRGNRIGVGADGNTPLANTSDGILIHDSATGTVIGGTGAGHGNIISGNAGYGIRSIGDTVDATTIQGNLIGVTANGAALGNDDTGIRIEDNSDGNTIGGTAAGAGNTIAHNNGDGVVIKDSFSAGNAILGNAIYSNTGHPIDLGDDNINSNDTDDADFGANFLKNSPEITAAVTDGSQLTVSGFLHSTPAGSAQSYRVEFYSSPGLTTSGGGQGRTYLGFANVDTDQASLGNSTGDFRVTLPVGIPSGLWISATATDSFSNTSEFSAAVSATSPLTSRPETQINTSVTNDQRTSSENRGSPRAIAAAPNGTSVAVWSHRDAANGWEIRAQRFDASGSKIGPEITVNASAAGDQQYATVAIDRVGNFVVAWSGVGPGDGSGIFYRRFNSAGAAIDGSDQRANTTTSGGQDSPVVAMDGDGNFVIAWEGNGPGDTGGIFARRFSASGAAIDVSESLVNSPSGSSQTEPGVAMNDSGQFVVVWDDGGGVHARIFDDQGVAQGGQLNVDSGFSAGESDVAIGSDGKFVVVWRETSFGRDIFARRFAADGTPLSGDFRVNTTISFDQTDPSITMDASGNYIVVWEGNGQEANNADGSGVFGRRYRFDGTPLDDAEFRVNQTTTGTQDRVSVAMLDIGNFVAVWTASDGNGDGVFARQFGTAATTGGFVLSTVDAVPATTAFGLPGWTTGDLLTFGEPQLALEPPTTSGSFGLLHNLNAFGDGDVAIDAVHLVGSTLTLGNTSQVTLNPGDLLLSTTNDEAFLNGKFSVGNEDVFVFSPTISGDYRSGEFTMLIDASDDPDLSFGDLHGVSLVEQNVTVGGTALTRGELLFTRSGAGENSDVYIFDPINVGAGTTDGNVRKLLEGSEAGISDQLHSLDLVETSTTVGGTLIAGGSLLLTIDGEGTVGNNALSVSRRDVFALLPTQTAPLVSLGNATLVFEGADAGLTGNEAAVKAFGLRPSLSPHLDLDADDSSGVSGLGYSATFVEGSGPVAIVDISDAIVTDQDSANLSSLTVTISNVQDGAAETLAANTAGTSISANYLANSLMLTGVDTVANYQQVLRTVTYDNSSSNPNAATRLVEFVASDGSTTGPTATAEVAVTLTNDAPLIDLDANDSSGATGADFETTFVEGLGSVAITDTDATLVDADNANLASLTVTITNIQDGAAEVLAADTTGTLILANYSAGTLTLSGSDTVANYQQVLRTVDYLNLSLSPTTTTRVVTFVANDGSLDSNTGTARIAVTATNNAPLLDLDADNSSGAGGDDFQTSFTEGLGAVDITDSADALLSDADSANLASLTVTISNVQDGADEVLSATTAGTSIIANYVGNVLTLNGSDTVANYQQVLRTIRYDNSSLNPDTTARLVTFQANDGTASSSVATASVTIVAIGNEPQLDLDADNSSGASGADFRTTFTSGSGPVAISDSADTVLADADSGTMAFATVTISNIQDGGAETLSANTAGTSISANYSAGTLTLSGADTVDHYEQVLRTVTYNNSSGTPAVTTRLIHFVVNDGTANGNTATAHVAIQVPAGIITDSDGSGNRVDENSASGTTVGVTATASDPNPGDSISFSLDNDAGGRFQIDSSSGVVSVDDSSLLDYELSTSHLITVRAESSDGSSSTRDFTILLDPVNDNLPVFTSASSAAIAEGSTTALTLTATDDDLPTQTISFSLIGGPDASRFFLDAGNVLTFASVPNFESPDDADTDNEYVVLIQASDGNGGSSNATVRINVTDGPDAPQAFTDTYAVDSNKILTIDAPGVLANDTDEDGDALAATVVSGPSKGSLELRADGSFKYTPKVSAQGIDSFTYRVADGNGGFATAVVTIKVTLVAAPPSIEPPPPLPEPPTEPETTQEETAPALQQLPVPGEGQSEPPNAPRRTLTIGESTRVTTEADTPRAIATSEVSETTYLVNGLEPANRIVGSRTHVRQPAYLQTVISTFDVTMLWNDLSELKRELSEGTDGSLLAAGSAVGVTSSLTVGYVLWTIRSGWLATSLLAQMPAWRIVDPLVVLDYLDNENGEADEDDSLETLLDQKHPSAEPDEEESAPSPEEGPEDGVEIDGQSIVATSRIEV